MAGSPRTACPLARPYGGNSVSDDARRARSGAPGQRSDQSRMQEGIGRPRPAAAGTAPSFTAFSTSSGDTLVVWKLDRLSRSLKDLLTILERTDTAGARFRSLTEAIDTSGAAGRMLMQMLGSFAEFEREMIRERTRAGLREARAKGRVPGRKRSLPSNRKRSSKPCHPGARHPPNSLACSKFIAQPCRGSSLRPAPGCEPVSDP